MTLPSVKDAVNESLKKRKYFQCDTDTFSTKACGETFKIQSGLLNCNSQKVVYLLKGRICGEDPYVGKAKTKFRARFKNYKGTHRSYRKKRKVSQQRFHEHYGQHNHNGINDWQFTLTEQCKTHEQLKEGETLWQYRLKTFYPYGLNEKKECLYHVTFSDISLIRHRIF